MSGVHIRHILLVTCIVSPAGCDDGGDEKAAAPQEAKKAEPPKPFEGELTFEMVKGFGSQTAVLYTPSGTPRAWDEAIVDVEAKLGKPTWTDGDKVAWGAVDGEVCTYILLEKKDGTVDMAGGGTGELKMLPPTMEKECRAAAGVAEPETAPTADPPPASGKTTVDVMIEGVEGNEKAWVGASVEVTGVFNAKTVAKSGDKEFVTLSIGVSKDELMKTIGCSLAQGQSLPDGTLQGTALTVKGTVEAFGGGSLKDCSIVPSP